MKLTLREKQSGFALMVGKLILFAYSEGYELTFGDAYAQSGHMQNSLHYVRLAVDFNLFKNGEYLKETEDHKPLGEYWEKELGGSWGGHFGDGNHYSLGHNGRK